jgi:uncharacterized protein
MTQPPDQYPPGPPNPDEPGYTPPPPSGYPPPGGYPPPAAAPPPPGYASADERTWALISHFGGAAGSFICAGALAFVAPMVAYLTKGKESPTVKAHSTAALNFFIPVSAVSVVAWVLYVCVGALGLGALGTLVRAVLYLVLIATWATGIIFGILAGIKAYEGTLYTYPLPFTVIR